MKDYPLEKYRFYRSGNTIIATSTYEGKIVKGYAKLDPRDKFNEDFGKMLAAARCNHKISRKRYRRALKKALAACDALTLAKREFNDMTKYFQDASEAYLKASKTVDALVATSKMD